MTTVSTNFPMLVTRKRYIHVYSQVHASQKRVFRKHIAVSFRTSAKKRGENSPPKVAFRARLT